MRRDRLPYAARGRLQYGRLVLISSPYTFAGLLYLYVAAGWLPTTWDERTGGHFVVDANAGRIRAAVDGEPEELETPLRFEIEPAALRVLLPPGL